MLNSKIRNYILGIFFILIGLISSIYSISVAKLRVSSLNYFMIIGVLSIIIGLVRILIPVNFEIKKFRLTLRIIKYTFFILLTSFIMIESLIIYSANVKQDVKADYIMILGAGLWGETPSLILLERLDTARQYINKYPDIKIILSGGKGPGETITEADAMEKYLVRKGANKENIIKEENSTDTMENFKFTKQILSSINPKTNIKLVIVTNGFHEYRSKLLAKRNGFIPYGYPAPTYKLLIPTYYVREYFALIKSVLLDK